MSGLGLEPWPTHYQLDHGDAITIIKCMCTKITVSETVQFDIAIGAETQLTKREQHIKLFLADRLISKNFCFVYDSYFTIE